MDHECRTYFGSQVISASDDMDVSKADSNFSKTTLAFQVLSNWKSLMTWPNCCNSAFATPLTMLSSGRLNKTTSLENVLDLTCFPFPPCADWLRLPPPLQGWRLRPIAAGCQFVLPSNWGGALAFLRWNICRNSSRGVREFTDWQGAKELHRTPDAAVALVIPEDDDAAIPEEPEDEGVTPEDEAEFTACLKSGCSIICLTRLSKLAGVEPRFMFAILGRQIPAKTSRGILEGDPLEHVSLYLSTDVKHSRRNSRSRFIAV